MTKQRTLKRRVRGRMAKTGESYMAARRQLLANAGALFLEAGDGNHPRPDPSVSSAADAARLRLLEKRRAWVEKATGLPMETWIATLDHAGAREMAHNEIWQWLAVQGGVTDGGLREGIVITYEQHY